MLRSSIIYSISILNKFQHKILIVDTETTYQDICCVIVRLDNLDWNDSLPAIGPLWLLWRLRWWLLWLLIIEIIEHLLLLLLERTLKHVREGGKLVFKHRIERCRHAHAHVVECRVEK